MLIFKMGSPTYNDKIQTKNTSKLGQNIKFIQPPTQRFQGMLILKGRMNHFQITINDYYDRRSQGENTKRIEGEDGKA